MLLEDISGTEVISFRAPALRINNDTAIALAETGYSIDSSVASQRFDFFMSFGSIKKLKWLSCPRLPYRTSPNSLLKAGTGRIIEIPLSAFFFPYVGTTMRMFPGLTALQRNFFHFETKCLNGKPIVFDIHPNEFIDESDEKRIIQRRSENKLAYLIQDWLRANMKSKNLGPKAIPLYEKEVDFYQSYGYHSVTLKEYCKTNNLIR